ncbi:tetratricopeptide repeat protein [Sporosarcina cascadiensis]|uniref:tetratricopeptide repeat protein n=1 Tax=Sporosarcina cascadiensis TaxID=2660747 RepID=UPI00129ABAF4|nr:hypothetical protein [Sporosarcina cascadiensis]
MSKLHFNPLLIQAMSDQPSHVIKECPSLSDLPGKLPKQIIQNVSQVPRKFPKNDVVFVCKICKKRGRYDAGHISINLEGHKQAGGTIKNYIQMTGYFRCKQCNSAGEWGTTQDFEMRLMGMLISMNMDESVVTYSIHQLFDGFQPRYGTEAEEHLLQKILEKPADAFLWNRLGNAYFAGARPDLAAAAFEHSLVCDLLQMESYFSLGMLVEEFDPALAVRFYHKMIAAAPYYTEMKNSALKELLAAGLNNLFNIKVSSEQEVAILPGEDIYEELGIEFPSADRKADVYEGTIELDNVESFYPLAKLLMKNGGKK